LSQDYPFHELRPKASKIIHTAVSHRLLFVDLSAIEFAVATVGQSGFDYLLPVLVLKFALEVVSSQLGKPTCLLSAMLLHHVLSPATLLNASSCFQPLARYVAFLCLWIFVWLNKA